MFNFSKISMRGLSLLIFAATVLLPARAQDVASLTGLVTDASGGSVSGVKIKLVDTRTAAAYTTETGTDGRYLIAKVPPGPGYALTASRDGFQTVTVSDLYLPIATTTTRNIQLEVGLVTQTVEVKSQGSVTLNTTDSTIGNNFDIREIQALPNEFRDNPSQLLRLEPGVVSAQSPSGPGGPNDPSGSRDGSVGGARADQNNITVDGIDAQDFGIGQAFALVAPIPVDAVQEFRTEVGNPLGDTGRASGATTVITSKGGTNDFHGNAYEYHRNTVTEANSFFNNKAGVDRPNLIRNQFGGNFAGPILKDKLFFFFEYDGRRDASQFSALQDVPLDSFRAGSIAYINDNAGCGPNSRQTSSPNCISFASPAQVAAFDPCSTTSCTGTPGFTAPGFDPALLQLINNRYPHANDLTQGDGINTGGFRFNAPAPLSENVYWTRVDYNINSKQKLFVRFNFNNFDTVVPGIPSVQFPGDPVTNPEVGRDRSWAIGHTWTFTGNTVNQFVYGEARNNLAFPIPFNPAGTVFPLQWFPQTDLVNPFARQSSQARILPIPTFRDDLTLIRGKHQFQVGVVWKPIRTRTELVNDFDFINVGIGNALNTLPATSTPGNILSDPNVDPNGVAVANWDGYFAGALGLINQDQSVFNYGKTGTAFNHGTGERRDYRYYDYEFYGQDTWKLRSDLTLTLGLRYQYDTVPYESNGLEATAVNTDLSQQLSSRVNNGLAGISGATVTPLLTYTLAGKGNSGAPSLYGGDKLNFSPRLGLSWNPSFRNGLLSRVLGDRKTVLRLGASQIYDQTALSAINFIQDQGSYLFGNVNSTIYGGLTQDPRFTAINSLPFTLAAPAFVNPLTPFTSGSGNNLVVNGAASGGFNYTIDPHFHTPYSNVFSAGVQRELPGNFQLEVDYYGRFGRRLFSLPDAGQVINFVDPASKHSYVGDVTTLEQEARQGVSAPNVAPLPFFENQGALALGAPCTSVLGTSCTQFIYANNGVPLTQGNLFGVAFFNTFLGLVPQNVGLPAQFAANIYVGNKAWSSYNSLFATLRKRLSRNLQMDFNYTFSHSLDNSSILANNVGNPAAASSVPLCDATNLSVCRGNSEFDVTHQVSSNFIYDLPFGRGQMVAGGSPRWLDEIIGGWQTSGIVTWRTGLALPVLSGVASTGATVDALAIFNGNQSAVSSNIHTDTSNNNVVQFFADPKAALAAFSPVSGTQVGNRDILRGPHFSNVDLGLVKNFPLYHERYKLQFRTDAFNVFNHPNFAFPDTNINSPNFGVVSELAGQEAARVLQLSLRFSF
jgi:Carboxypeptidase regulatory-like domain